MVVADWSVSFQIFACSCVVLWMFAVFFFLACFDSQSIWAQAELRVCSEAAWWFCVFVILPSNSFFIRTNQIKPVESELPAACLMWTVRSYVSLWATDTGAGKKKIKKSFGGFEPESHLGSWLGVWSALCASSSSSSSSSSFSSSSSSKS